MKTGKANLNNVTLPSREIRQKAAEKPEFPVVGIGASAGGLEALEQFFSNLPDASGIAFIIIQHLDPNHAGIMPELLQRITTMKVIQAKDNLKVQPNQVYVIPPNKSMSKHAREVLRTLMFRESDISTTDNKWYKVRIMPYRTLDEKIDGVVITFIDISVAKKMEAELKETIRILQEHNLYKT